MKRILFVLGLTIPLSAFCTCIFILKRNNTVLIAADSKRTFAKGGPLPQTICKIHKSGSCYFAVAGHADSALTAIVRQTLNSSLPIPELIKQCAEKLKIHYKNIMNDPTHTFPEELKYYLSNSLADVAFIYFKDKTPIIDEMAIEMKLKKGVLQFSDTVLTNLTEAFLGYRDHIENPNDPEPHALIQKYFYTQPFVFMKEMIKLEIKYHDETVGEPIDVVQLRPEGEPIWYPAQRSCPAGFAY